MISVRDLVEGQKVDSQDKYGDWWSATIQSVKLKAKKPYATLSWDEFPSSPPDKVYESAGKIRERKGKAFRKLESLQRRGLLAGRNSDGTYDVERIVAERKVGGRVRFKLRWRGYDASFDEWQPERHVSNDLIAAWRKGIRKGIGGGAKNSGKKKREAYVLSLPDESVERRALRQTDAQEDVDDFALDAVDMLKKAKKPMAVRKLHKKNDVFHFKEEAEIHGEGEPCDDSLLEKGNREQKALARLNFWGGTNQEGYKYEYTVTREETGPRPKKPDKDGRRLKPRTGKLIASVVKRKANKGVANTMLVNRFNRDNLKARRRRGSSKASAAMKQVMKVVERVKRERTVHVMSKAVDSL